MEYKNIICPVDDTGIADVAERHAAYISKISGCKVTLLYVVEKWYRSQQFTTNSDEWESIHNDWLKQGREFLQQEAGKVKGYGAQHIDTVLRDGDAAHEIIATAFETRADLIIMATHRYSPIGKIFLGSVTDRVSKKAPCPVLWVFK